MKKSTKGAFAAAAAGILLLGGAGSLAYWTDAETVGGGSIASGHLKLLPVGSATGCAGWTFADGSAFAATDEIVPGDTLKQTCTYTADMVGKNLKATLSVENPELATGTLADSLVVTPAFKLDGVAVEEGDTAVLNDDNQVTAVVTVAFPVGDDVDNSTNKVTGLTAVLKDFTITATQLAAAPLGDPNTPAPAL
jgi:alternate signal-mediated exported protein